VVMHLADCAEWPQRAVLLTDGCDRCKRVGKKQKYHTYPESIRTLARTKKVTLDSRPNLRLPLLHIKQRSHGFHPVPEILQAQVLVGGVLIIVIVGDGYCDGASLRGTFHRSQWHAPSHGGEQHYVFARALHCFNY